MHASVIQHVATYTIDILVLTNQNRITNHPHCVLYTTIYVEVLPERIFANFANACRWRKFFPQIFLHSENFDSEFRAHAYMCIAHTKNSQAPPTTSWKVIRAIGGNKFGEIFVPIQSMSLWQKF